MDVEQNMVAFETAMRWNGFNSPTRSATGDGYTHARDADRFRGWELHRESQALEVEYLQAIEAAARRVVAAFEALGTAQHAGSLLMERGNCETAMVALKALLFNTERSGAERPTGALS